MQIGEMPRASRKSILRNRSLPDDIDLYDYAEHPPAKPRGSAAAKDDLSNWRVIDDWPEDVPVTPEEVDVFERWFGDLLDQMFGPPVDRKTDRSSG